MTKRLVTGLLLSLVTLGVNAQWTAKDSLNLQRMLEGEGEVKLNREAIKLIDFGKVIGAPGMSTAKSWMLPDESLPTILPEKKKIVLTLYPYTANTRFDWDPVYQRKIKVDKNTWRADEFYAMKMQKEYTNQMKHPMEGSIPLGKGGVNVAGGTISGLDLMLLFQKSFWDVKGNKRRLRTLEVLEMYGDSTITLFPDILVKPTIR